eukprot:8726736-Pyramimonas_sp.AAC.1
MNLVPAAHSVGSSKQFCTRDSRSNRAQAYKTDGLHKAVRAARGVGSSTGRLRRTVTPATPRSNHH